MAPNVQRFVFVHDAFSAESPDNRRPNLRRQLQKLRSLSSASKTHQNHGSTRGIHDFRGFLNQPVFLSIRHVGHSAFKGQNLRFIRQLLHVVGNPDVCHSLIE